MEVLDIFVIERLIVPYVGLTEEDTVDKRPKVMSKAFQIGRSL